MPEPSVAILHVNPEPDPVVEVPVMPVWFWLTCQALDGEGVKSSTVKVVAPSKNAGYDVLVAGNVGVGFASSIAKRDYDYIVLELSSFQLENINHLSLDISCILNISEDHLDRYDDLDEYIQAKLNIVKATKDIVEKL